MNSWQKWIPKRHVEENPQQIQERNERRQKVNGPEPYVNPYCNCGAKFDREFPNIHSLWCKVYVKLEE